MRNFTIGFLLASMLFLIGANNREEKTTTPIVRVELKDKSIKWRVFNGDVVIDVVKDSLMIDYFYILEGTEHWCCAGYKEE